jgi:hypothetical protein
MFSLSKCQALLRKFVEKKSLGVCFLYSAQHGIVLPEPGENTYPGYIDLKTFYCFFLRFTLSLNHEL